LINRRIVDSYADILSVGEETDSRYIGEVLDANDVIRLLHGDTAIGVAQRDVPPVKKGGGGLFNREPKHFSVSKEQIERASNAVHEALSELSVDCEHHSDDSEVLYDAGGALGLFSGPEQEATEEIIEMMDNILASKVPGAKRRKGTYPGRTSNTITITLILTDIGHGALMEKVEWFYTEALKYRDLVDERSKERGKKWSKVSEAGKALPDL
jgi:hypothetical protein